MNQSIKIDISSWRNTIYDHMLRTRGKKYRWFLRHMKMFRLIAKTPKRAEFLETYYTLMRFLDDIVDDDAPVPKGFPNAEAYIRDKITFAENPIEPKDDVDALMLYCFQLGDSFNEHFQEETKAILGSLIFDAQRMNKLHFFQNRVLLAHYHELDVFGTIRATMKLFNEDPNKYFLLNPLGMACRFYYDLRDFKDDIQKGLINISQEDQKRFEINSNNLHEVNSLPIRLWFRAQALRGMALLDEHKQNMPKSGFRLTTKLTFPLVYAGPARRFFVEVLNKTKDLGDLKEYDLYDWKNDLVIMPVSKQMEL